MPLSFRSRLFRGSLRLVGCQLNRHLHYLLYYIIVVRHESHNRDILEAPALAHLNGTVGCGSVAAESNWIATHRKYLGAEHIVVDIILIDASIGHLLLSYNTALHNPELNLALTFFAGCDIGGAGNVLFLLLSYH